ncbi:response regulator [Archangium lansingense]|uniref:Response regulator n=1 Tax=Archangium lansingense TaxID=2995310 RepID=A0ABT4A5M2_9BACT|nr:response regulator [Archangium lansinium]MCY1076951.1 response regulator [Archangium lansinium]
MSNPTDKRRILVIDDSEAIHTDFRRILNPEQRRGRDDLDLLEEALFGPTPSRATAAAEPEFEVDSAFQGQEGLAKVTEALAAGRPYSLVFLDYRMPPGWNGAETLRRLREVAPALRVVLCSAYSDYSWAELLQEFGEHQTLRELRKPFNGQEVRQLALTLTTPSNNSSAAG